MSYPYGSDRAIRAWGLDNGFRCSTGRLGKDVRLAYHAANGFPPVPGEPPLPELEPETPLFRLVVELPGAEEVNEEASAQLLEAVWTIFHAGRAAERRTLLAQLGGES